MRKTKPIPDLPRKIGTIVRVLSVFGFCYVLVQESVFDFVYHSFVADNTA
jgi:hypothetical protein